MSTTWPSAVIGDYAANKCVRTGRVSALRSRDLCLIESPFCIYFAEVSFTTTGTYATQATVPLFLPDYAAGKNLTGTIWAKSDGAQVLRWRFKIGSTYSGTNGTTQSASYVFEDELSIVLPDTPDTEISLEIQGYVYSSATVYLKCEGDLSFYFED